MQEKEYKRIEKLLCNTLTYLSSYLVNAGVGYEDELKVYEKMGFSKEEINYFGLRDYDLELELELINEEEYNKLTEYYKVVESGEII